MFSLLFVGSLERPSIFFFYFCQRNKDTLIYVTNPVLIQGTNNAVSCAWRLSLINHGNLIFTFLNLIFFKVQRPRQNLKVLYSRIPSGIKPFRVRPVFGVTMNTKHRNNHGPSLGKCVIPDCHRLLYFTVQSEEKVTHLLSCSE